MLRSCSISSKRLRTAISEPSELKTAPGGRMPILEVEIVNTAGEPLDDGLAQQLADIAGKIFESNQGETWVKVRSLPCGQYAENDDPQLQIRPVFVSVVLRQYPSGEVMRKQADKLAASIARICGRSKENVHILYQPDAAARIAFGGNLVTKRN